NRLLQNYNSIQSFGSGLLKGAANAGSVAVAKIGALHHEHVGHSARRIHPRLRSPRAAVAIGAGRKHGRNSRVRSAQDACPNSPTVVFSILAIFRGLEKTGGQVAGLDGGEKRHGRRAEITPALSLAAAEEHLAEAGIIGAGGVKSTVAERRMAHHAEIGVR